jgi:hypothetical protein
MQWHHGGIGLEIKDQIRMASRNQFMVNVADRISNVARNALLSPFDQIPRVVHTHGSRRCIPAGNMGPEPALGLAMAGFTTDAILDPKRRAS